MTDHDRLMDVLADAMDRPAGPERAAFLDAACAGDAALRRDVDRLLARHDAASAVFGNDKLAADWVPASAFGAEPSTETTVAVSRLVGSRVGPYELTGVLGRGGMGVVYRGHDPRLGRAVAIKSLPMTGADAAGRARFAREARLLASLSHPNLAAVYGLEETPAGRFLVMELVEGRTLGRRLAEGPMPVDEAIRACAQVAAGLAAAHDAGVVHRDVKPGNVMLAAGGAVKVLDFGLARSLAPATPLADADSPSAYASMNVTSAHEVLGTPRYMSPEQLRGEPADRRSDVFAFGCVLYECLTGTPAFGGDSVGAVVAAVAEKDPDFDRLPAETPPLVVALLRRCLAKDRDRRPRDLADVRLELEEVLAGPASAVRSTGFQPVSGHRLEACATNGDSPSAKRDVRRVAFQSAALLACVGIGAVATRLATNPSAAPQTLTPSTTTAATSTVGPPSTAFERFTVPLPGDAPDAELTRLSVALSRDGRRLLATTTDGTNGRRLFARGRGSLAFRPVEGTNGASLASVSADGKWVVTIEGGNAVKRPLDGGAAVTIAPAAGRGGPPCLGADGVLTFVPAWGQGIARAADGGPAKVVTTVDAAAGEAAHLLPTVTPDGRSIVFTVRDDKAGTRIDACDLDGTGRPTLVADGAGGRVVNAPAGPHLLFERGGSIVAVRYDAGRRAVVGGERRVASGVAVDRDASRPLFDVADDGTLAYVAGPRFVESNQLRAVQAGGASAPVNLPAGAYAEPRASADGSRVSLIVKGETRTVAVYDAATWLGDPVRTAGDVSSAAVSPDGARLAYAERTAGRWAVAVRTLADGKEVRAAAPSADAPRQLAWSPDGKQVYFSASPGAGPSRDVWAIDAAAGQPIGSARPVVSGPADERSPSASRDGRWLAYTSDATGQREVYVRPLADAAATPLKVTVAGGDSPAWSPAADRLYFRVSGFMSSVTVDPTTGKPQSRGNPITARPFGQADADLADFTVTPDGLLVVEPADGGPTAGHVTVVLNWWGE